MSYYLVARIGFMDRDRDMDRRRAGSARIRVFRAEFLGKFLSAACQTFLLLL